MDDLFAGIILCFLLLFGITSAIKEYDIKITDAAQQSASEAAAIEPKGFHTTIEDVQLVEQGKYVPNYYLFLKDDNGAVKQVQCNSDCYSAARYLIKTGERNITVSLKENGFYYWDSFRLTVVQ